MKYSKGYSHLYIKRPARWYKLPCVVFEMGSEPSYEGRIVGARGSWILKL